MTKQEKIKEAWGECWNKLPNEAQEKAFKNNGFVSKYFEYNNGYFKKGLN